MSFHALVIDNNIDILEDIADRLESLGHSCDCASFQDKARRLLHKNMYSYVLLELEIPVKKGRRSRVQNGQNLIHEIRHMKGYETLPIIIMASHDKYSPELAIEAMRCNGANDFVSKSATPKGRTIEKAIVDALRAAGRAHPAAKKLSGLQLSPEPPHRFETGEMIFFPGHVELCGVKVCGDRTATIRRILDVLQEKKSNGKYVSYDGERLAKLVDCEGGQNAIATCIMEFRNFVCQVLSSEAQIECDRLNDIIVNDRRYGYRLSAKITVRQSGDVHQMSVNVPQYFHQNGYVPQYVHQNVRQNENDVHQYQPKNKDLNERQLWIIQELQRGAPLQNRHIRSQFRVSSKTINRDLTDLRIGGLITFIGSSKNGFWKLTG